MKPPYEVTNTILKQIASISEKIGEVNAAHLQRPSPELRKKNRVKTINASLEIEGNTLSEDQITAIIDQKRVIGPERDILEVQNAIRVYEKLTELRPFSLKSFLTAHQKLMRGLLDSAGKLRTRNVGIAKGTQVTHVAPPAANLRHLMDELFAYLKNSDDPVLIKSCVAHYEIEFIHPFMDGNGRMGRLWQSVILTQAYPVFEHLPFETIIRARQQEYYDVLAHCDKVGNSTKFIEFSLSAIDASLESLLSLQHRPLTTEGRVNYFLSTSDQDVFSRKDYLQVFRDISPATASRDLKFAVEQGMIYKEGDKRTALYRFKSRKSQ
jgi:Fic family protein